MNDQFASKEGCEIFLARGDMKSHFSLPSEKEIFFILS